ncbi:MAG: 16S rRNA (cytidine(1402)-2'-O)-methyltransferase [Proteobacteria bacterium]|nr:MAG: 16S rRNA (cytidine(1402)-2'-O)-methyltransferase [Pseudomonadota bacterium]
MTSTLYIVATPIGNLGDMTARAIQILSSVERIYAEDTRNSQGLLTHFGIKSALSSLHEHNESARIDKILAELEQGLDVALISDAGTPLISDPGYRLVKAVSAAGYRVAPIPGASALIAALSVAGLPSDRFVFEGFLPAKPAARRVALENLKQEQRTLIFYESSHRIAALLDDVLMVLGGEREISLARELTKLYEQVYRGSCAALREQMLNDTYMQKGEFVVMLAGAEARSTATSVSLEHETLLKVLLEEGLPIKQLARIAARLTGLPKNHLYRQAMSLSALDSAGGSSKSDADSA